MTQFGQFTLRLKEQRLEGPGGPIELSARAFEILCLLLDRPGELVSKDEIFAAVWPGVVVEENTLQVHISTLRKVLDPSMVVTVHGRGYKYGGPQPQVEPNTPALARVSGFKPVVVVLPFENLSGDPDQLYFSDGITHDITDRLTLFREFSVIGQHSASAFSSAASDMRSIRQRLGADFVVTGNLRRAGDRVRIAVRLSDAASESALWADRYDRPTADIFSLQDEISALVAAAIARHLEVEINVRNSPHKTSSFSSYEHFLEGYWHYRKATRATSLRAAECFRRAIAVDPNNAVALSWLAVTHTDNWMFDFSFDNAVKGVQLATEAAGIYPSSPICQGVKAWTLVRSGQLEAGVHAIERAFALNPVSPEVLSNMALAKAYHGDLAAANEFFAQSRKLDPLPPYWLDEFQGIAMFAERRYEDCLRVMEPILQYAWNAMWVLVCCGHLGLKNKAREVLVQFDADGKQPDWFLGISREPYRSTEVRERLRDGLTKALDLGER